MAGTDPKLLSSPLRKVLSTIQDSLEKSKTDEVAKESIRAKTSQITVLLSFLEAFRQRLHPHSKDMEVTLRSIAEELKSIANDVPWPETPSPAVRNDEGFSSPYLHDAALGYQAIIETDCSDISSIELFKRLNDRLLDSLEGTAEFEVTDACIEGGDDEEEDEEEDETSENE